MWSAHLFELQLRQGTFIFRGTRVPEIIADAVYRPAIKSILCDAPLSERIGGGRPLLVRRRSLPLGQRSTIKRVDTTG